MPVNALDETLQTLLDRGVEVVDPRQTYVDESVDPARICPGAVLHPGTRLLGKKTFVGPGAQLGTEGPVVIHDAVLDRDSEVASGYVRGAVLLRGARLGANAHVRPWTLLEEEASTAHAVGLKHTILMSFATLGSLINFCDGLIYGGPSRQDHTEIGSGFIHFNFAPWGARGHKATPSLIGDAARGVFLREPRVFLGGLSGLAGPQRVGFGALAVAGQVIRTEVPAGQLFSDLPRRVRKFLDVGAQPSPVEPVLSSNLRYIGQLHALRVWYEAVRLPRLPAGSDFDDARLVLAEAIALLGECFRERVDRAARYASERGISLSPLSPAPIPCPLPISSERPYADHVDWVRSLAAEAVEQGQEWLQATANSVSFSAESTKTLG